jgi:hypothetical protein
MNELFGEIVDSARTLPVDSSDTRDLFAEGNPGARIAALALADARPSAEAMDMAIAGIKNARSPFEQYHALRLARGVFDRSTEDQRMALREALLVQEGTPIHDTDDSRRSIKEELLKKLPEGMGGLEAS